VDIFKFAEHLQAKGISKLRVVKYIYNLKVFARFPAKPLRELNREDIDHQ
jgi:hypothetical protein